VVDSIERFTMRDFNYRDLPTLGDDVVLLEWDIAVGQQDLRRFIQRAAATPDRVLVAPYRLHNMDPKRAVWAHRRNMFEWVDDDEPECYMFGFGMIYLPLALISVFSGPQLNDGIFSWWHYHNVQPQAVPIAWDVRPVHLNYEIAPIMANDDP
jgi:hypothetical protein